MATQNPLRTSSAPLVVTAALACLTGCWGTGGEICHTPRSAPVEVLPAEPLNRRADHQPLAASKNGAADLPGLLTAFSSTQFDAFARPN